MKSLKERLATGEILVADGGMGTSLQQRGLPAGGCPESFNLEQPAVLTEIAQAYVDAGADILLTNTFGGSPLRLAVHELAAQAALINAVAVAAAKNAAGDQALVIGSVGPCGRLLEPYGDVSTAEVLDSFGVQIQALATAGVDGICIETMTDLQEALLAVRATREIAPDLPVLVTLTFESTPRGFFTMMGNDIPSAASALAKAGADVVGSNCGNGSKLMVEVAQAFSAVTNLPLLVQANAGLPALRDGLMIYDETPAFMAEQAERMLAVGVRIVGGCCGTTPDHVRALRRIVDCHTQ